MVPSVSTQQSTEFKVLTLDASLIFLCCTYLKFVISKYVLWDWKIELIFRLNTYNAQLIFTLFQGYVHILPTNTNCCIPVTIRCLFQSPVSHLVIENKHSAKPQKSPWFLPKTSAFWTLNCSFDKERPPSVIAKLNDTGCVEALMRTRICLAGSAGL